MAMQELVFSVCPHCDSEAKYDFILVKTMICSICGEKKMNLYLVLYDEKQIPVGKKGR